MANQDPNSPAWRDPALALYAPQRERNDDVFGGTDVLREKASIYLPKLPRETLANYAIRKDLGEVTNLFKGAVRAAEGLMTATPIALEDGASPKLTTLCQDIDGRGTAVSVWLRGVIRRMLKHGWCVTLTSTPIRADETVTRADEDAKRLLPWVVIYNADDVMSARMVRVGGRDVLAQIVLRESVKEVDGLFGVKDVEQYRVLKRGGEGAPHTSQVYRLDDKGNPAPFGPVVTIETDELPVVEWSAEPDAGFGQAAPPLTEIADATISHFRITNDRRWSMKGGCFPWLVRIGYSDDGAPTSAGVNEALDIPMGGDAKWIAPGMEATQPTRDELTDIERRAASLSLSFLSGESSNEQQTATAASIDQEGQDAGLAAMAVSVRDAANRLGALLAEMLGEDVKDTYFVVNTKFRGRRKDPAFMRVVLDAWKEGGLPLDALIYVLQHGELGDDFDAEQAALDALAEAEVDRQKAMELAQQTAGNVGPLSKQAA